ncbi:Lysophospholipase 1 [Podosphaera aphanis]|nr:Lysophospholipase 1 [Podosphaera aphanis]
MALPGYVYALLTILAFFRGSTAVIYLDRSGSSHTDGAGTIQVDIARPVRIDRSGTIHISESGSMEVRSVEVAAAKKRAFPVSPSGGYAPGVVNCPSERPVIRNARDISQNEKSWLQLRRNQTIDPMISWLSRAEISGFDTTSYINQVRNDASLLPNIGIAISGGGYRSLFTGGGFLAAADDRVDNSTSFGQIGGLLQATTYVAGVSGGSWVTGSMFINNFSSVQALRDGGDRTGLWKFGNSILQSPDTDGPQILDDINYFRTIIGNVRSKSEAGFATSITDYWGRALSFQLVNATDGGPAYTFSSITLQDNFRDGSIPFPLVVADNGIEEATRLSSVDSTVYEINPFELGSWDSTTNAFAPTKYLGSNFDAGSIPSDGQCVEGFDQAGFVLGTSSSVFNQIFVGLNQSRIPDVLTDALAAVSSTGNNNIARYQPNPFFRYNTATSRIAEDSELTLADGGIDGQNIPFYPLIQPQRAVDVIYAVDSSSDTTFNWPNGTSLVATYERSLNSTVQSGIAFPSIPDQNTFVNLGLNMRPTFFGCNASNITGNAPLIVYIPNAPYIVQSNVSTFNASFTDRQRNLLIRNGYDVATLSNSTNDPQWPACLACAALSRSFTKTGTTAPKACRSCFERYCWDGTLNSTRPQEYAPQIQNTSALSGSNSLKASVGLILAASLVMVLETL